MSVARVLSRTELGLEAPQVQVEVHLGAGLPGFTIVGLPAPVVRESRERVRAAMLNSGYEFPQRRITVNLAPVELFKQGGRFDLPIALGLLIASGQLSTRVASSVECYGELGLAGELKPVAGLFLAALQAARAGHALIVPSGNAEEVALAAAPVAWAAAHLRAAARALFGAMSGRPAAADAVASADAAAAATAVAATAVAVTGARHAAGGNTPAELFRIQPLDPVGLAATQAAATPELADVVGQHQAKRALVVAAAGGHSLLMIGPPGSGKSMLAARLPALLPPLTQGEALEVAGILAVSRQPLDPRRWRCPPFRSPHHTSSAGAMVGGGAALLPGEISLAHRGVLFLDELPEFDRRVLEALREPLECGRVTIARTAWRVQLPARFQLVAAMNPCPCGYHGDARVPCRCTPAYVRRYRERVSGPLMDRIDIRVSVARLASTELTQLTACAPGGMEAADILDPEGRANAVLAREPGEDLVVQARAARARRVSLSGTLSAWLSAAELRRCCRLPAATARLMRRSCQRWPLSGRGVQRLLALSRTIADLADSDSIEPQHLAEAIQLRRPFEML